MECYDYHHVKNCWFFLTIHLDVHIRPILITDCRKATRTVWCFQQVLLCHLNRMRIAKLLISDKLSNITKLYFISLSTSQMMFWSVFILLRVNFLCLNCVQPAIFSLCRIWCVLIADNWACIFLGIVFTKYFLKKESFLTSTHTHKHTVNHTILPFVAVCMNQICCFKGKCIFPHPADHSHIQFNSRGI